MYCKHCGSQIEDDCKFCPVCGKPVSPAAPKKVLFLEEDRLARLGTRAPVPDPNQESMQEHLEKERQKYYEQHPEEPDTISVKKEPRKVPTGCFTVALIFILAPIVFMVFSDPPSSSPRSWSSWPPSSFHVSSSSSSSTKLSRDEIMNGLTYEMNYAILTFIEPSTLTGKVKIDYSNFKCIESDKNIFVAAKNFTTKNAFNVDIKFTATGIYEFTPSSQSVDLKFLSVDDTVYYSDPNFEFPDS